MNIIIWLAKEGPVPPRPPKSATARVSCTIHGLHKTEMYNPRIVRTKLVSMLRAAQSILAVLIMFVRTIFQEALMQNRNPAYANSLSLALAKCLFEVVDHSKIFGYNFCSYEFL